MDPVGSELPLAEQNAASLAELPPLEQLHPQAISASYIVISIILSSIVVCTFVGNLFVIAAILIDKNLQTTANQLVLSLAVADLMVACLVMPLGAYNDINQGWWLGKGVCEFWTSADVLCCTGKRFNNFKIRLNLTHRNHPPPTSLDPEPARDRPRPLLGRDERRLHLQANAATGQPDDFVRLDSGRDRLAGPNFRLEGPRLCTARTRGAQVFGEPGRWLSNFRNDLNLLRASGVAARALLAHFPGK
ncbi:5-hydroxytryptamine receptor 2A-like [Olea europaea subsp. europaea]|uniref:5-hydroxytryptamine receptor 2A-like n=1 Tax=Olea europaea subsp. europaea TaxID=158383 RepID=A0A8S0RD37_OLEEU|nr:5-hydroxytryptamine receptor 2A-like [Olea europaea subsp. europaea]